MSHRTTSALVLLTAGTLAMTAVTTPAAFAANSPEESQPGTPAPTTGGGAPSPAPPAGPPSVYFVPGVVGVAD